MRLYVIEWWFYFPPHLFSATVLPWENGKTYKWCRVFQAANGEDLVILACIIFD